MSDLKPAKLKVVELREELSKRGLDTKGLKAELVARLTDALQEETASTDAVKVLQEKQVEVPDVAEIQVEKEEQGVGRVMVEGDEEAAQELEDAVKDTKEAKEVEKTEPAALDPEVAKVVAEEEVKERIPIQDRPPSPVRRISPLPASKPASPKPEPEKAATPPVEEVEMDIEPEAPSPVAPAPPAPERSSAPSPPAAAPVVVEPTPPAPAPAPAPAASSHPAILTPPMPSTDLPPARNKRSRSPSPPSLIGSAPSGPKRRRIFTTPLPASLSHLVHPPTTILYIRNLRRPLQNSALHEYLYPSSTPAPSSSSSPLPPPMAPFATDDHPGLWVSGIKDHAYAAYPSVEDAIEAAERIDGAQFPPETGETLGVEFVDDEQVKGFVEREEFAWRNGRQKMVLSVREQDGDYVFDLRVDLGNGRGLPGARGNGVNGGVVGAGVGAPPPIPPAARGIAGHIPPVGGLAARMGPGPGVPGRQLPFGASSGGAPFGGASRLEEGRIGMPVNRTKVRPNLTWREGPGAERA